MSAKKTITIVGATGTQGASVARTFLELPNWHVRCLTRQPNSEKAMDLEKRGAELVKGDLEDEASLQRAFDNVHAIFLNTDFWIPFRKAIALGQYPLTASQEAYEIEVMHGKNAAKVAATIPTLERFIYSALGPMSKASNGKYPYSYHWETKAKIVEYIEDQQPELARKTSYVYIGAYITNAFLYPKFDPESESWVSILPTGKETRFPIINVPRSTGLFVRALVEDEEPRTRLLAYDDYLSVGEVGAIWTKTLGNEVKLIQMTMEAMSEKTGVPLEILMGAAYLGEYSYCAGVPNVIEPAQLKTRIETQTFETWLKEEDAMELLELNK
ncbi:hypothetical protein N7509_006000 [Penicillium cosmopolitanum]|uniref:NmrA-like domain-containing protein n=1 Tax=Penicillium cosmopolitanum TaxID=1131564 RepID=A0A9W9W3H8_9EURO|nr:uncharacterized protein N7509_006000 [Penicillium cosmopolitanum]KAJ5397887.1 hypothetical protein N7509_006000 [Penicillium cosmopolitanum]